MQFHEIRFPEHLSFGSSGGPERRTEIVALTNGFEERNTPWAQSRRRYDAGVGLRSLDDIAALVAFFEARRGQLHGFRWKDWFDFKSCPPSATPSLHDQMIGVGDGATRAFTLTKAYVSGGVSYVREVKKPVGGTISVGVSGVAQILGVDATVDPTQGQVTFATPPDAGAEITAGFEFDVPVRFDTEAIVANAATFQAGEIPSVPVVEIRI